MMHVYCCNVKMVAAILLVVTDWISEGIIQNNLNKHSVGYFN